MVILTILLVGVASAFPTCETQHEGHWAPSLQAGVLVQGLFCFGDLPLESTKLTANTSVAFDAVTFTGWAAMAIVAATILSHWPGEGTESLLVVLAGAGALLLAAQSASMLLVLLELQSYATYVLVALNSTGGFRSAGTSIYFLIGATATAGIIVGWGILFRSGALACTLGPGQMSNGSRLQVAGLLTKLGCFPFSMWLPAAYGGMKYAGLSSIAVLPQIALLMQISGTAALDVTLIYGVAGASVFVGSLLSAAATSMRRLLALSGTAHAGYALSGVSFSNYAVLTYTLVYASIFILLCWSLEACVGPVNVRVSTVRGALSSFLLPGTALGVTLLSLGGVPPLVGFFTKSYILLGGIGLNSTLGVPFFLLLAGAAGLVSYLRVSLAVTGYPQSNGYLLQSPRFSKAGLAALIVGLTGLSESLIGSFLDCIVT